MVNSFSPGLVGKLAYALMFAGALVLGASGIGTFATGNAPMTGWILMAHVGSSGMFSIGLMIVALTWTSPVAQRGGISWLFYWILLLSGWLVIVSGVVPMTPVFGTHGQHLLYLIHRYSALVAAAAAVLHLLTCRSER